MLNSNAADRNNKKKLNKVSGKGDRSQAADVQWVIPKFMHMNDFYTKLISLDRVINTKLKNINILLGNLLFKKIDDELQKKVRVQK